MHESLNAVAVYMHARCTWSYIIFSTVSYTFDQWLHPLAPQHLTFDIHVLIVCNLNLRDALSYADLLPVCHDAVHYVFAHRQQLDFSSTLNNNYSDNQSDKKLLDVLNACTHKSHRNSLFSNKSRI